VTFTGPEVKSVSVGKDGRFQTDLQTGTYTVVGRSPLYHSSADGRPVPCRPARNAVVRESATTNVLVVCLLI
jgi:hypothetical protein